MSARAWKRRRGCKECGVPAMWRCRECRQRVCGAHVPHVEHYGCGYGNAALPKQAKRQGRARIEQRDRERRAEAARWDARCRKCADESRHLHRHATRGFPSAGERRPVVTNGIDTETVMRRLTKHQRGAKARRARASQQRADERRGT